MMRREDLNAGKTRCEERTYFHAGLLESIVWKGKEVLGRCRISTAFLPFHGNLRDFCPISNCDLLGRRRRETNTKEVAFLENRLAAQVGQKLVGRLNAAHLLRKPQFVAAPQKTFAKESS